MNDSRCHCFDTYTGSIGYGHWASDDAGWFYSCVEKERYARRQAMRSAERESRERGELARLKAKYESEVSS